MARFRLVQLAHFDGRSFYLRNHGLDFVVANLFDLDDFVVDGGQKVVHQIHDYVYSETGRDDGHSDI